MLKQCLLLICLTLTITACQTSPDRYSQANMSPTTRQDRSPAYQVSDLRPNFRPADIHQCSITHEHTDGRYIATQPWQVMPLIDAFPDAESLGTEKNALTLNSSTSSQNDLWSEIANQFSFKVPKNNRVTKYKRWFLENPLHVETVTNRAEPFLYYIYQQVKARGLPVELVLLPFIESSFDQFAYSPKGAAGLWQITAPTGKTFGLEMAQGYDGRRDVIEATQAALDLLEYLYDKFDNNWLHAIAAYNTGGARVRNAIKQNRQQGKATDFWSLQLPNETRQYVPKLLAMADLIKHRHQHELPIVAIEAKPVVDEIVVDRRVRLKTIANHAGISSKQLYQLNPGYTGGYTFKNRENKILLPRTHKATLYENEKSYHYVKNKFEVYDIQAGDTLSELASLNDTSVSLIKEINNLPDSVIFVGQKLLIPRQ